MSELIFADIEASGLQFLSYPIEFGWARIEGNCVVAESVLIKPTSEWLNWKTGWNEEAEQLHGITIDQLMTEGLTPSLACQKINETLEGREIAFDTGPAAHDYRWMTELYKAASLQPNFKLAQISSDIAILAFAKMLRVPDSITLQLEHLAPKTVHRAAADAAHWAWWRLALRRISEYENQSSLSVADIVSSISIKLA